MQSLLRILLVSLFVSVTSCGDGSSSKSPPRSSVTIDGIQIVFNESPQWYDWTADETHILLSQSNPPGWRLDFYWPGDSGPGSSDTSQGDFELYVDAPPPRSIYHATAATTQAAALQITQFAYAIGERTHGSFSGTVEQTSDPTDVLVLEDGEFRTARQN